MPITFLTNEDKTIIDQNITQLSEEIAGLKGEGDEGGPITITFTASDVFDNCFVTPDGDTSSTAQGYHCINYTSLAKFKEGVPVTVRCTIIGNCSLVFYDATRNVLLAISGTNAANYGITPGWKMQYITITPPDGAAYIRFGAKSESSTGADYTGPSDFVLSGESSGGATTTLNSIKKKTDASLTDFSELRVLVIGDSISVDYYGDYKKWVTHLKNIEFFGFDNTVNDSVHATGFVARYNNEANDFITRIEAVANPETYDMVIVFGGINDYIKNIPMGESGGDKLTSFKPAVDDFFATLTETFVGARIAVLTPLRTSNYNNANTAGHKQSDYADYIKSVAQMYALPVLDLMNQSGFHPEHDAFRQRWTFKDWTGGDGTQGDGTHPIEEYECKHLAPMIRHFLQGLL